MLSKIVLLFLAFIAVLGIFGKLRFPGQARLASRRCPNCGRFRIGPGPCDCGAGGTGSGKGRGSGKGNGSGKGKGSGKGNGSGKGKRGG